MPDASAGDISEGLPAHFTDGVNIARTEIPDGATTVLLGECTHGTEEFYRLRAEISKYLIETRGFNIILCESDWTFMWHVNQYVHRKKSNMFPSTVRFPDWMWKNRPFYDLVEWMRKRASSDGPHVFGMDCYCKEEAKEEVLTFFDLYDRENLGKDFRQSCYPAEQPENWPNILAKLQWEFEHDAGTQLTRTSPDVRSTGDGSCGGIVLASNKFKGCSKLDRFNVEQNLECMIAADEYYSKQRLEPPGSRASWNARDQHMMTTILRLKSRSKELFGLEEKDLKIIIWAHNSHIGDATSTPMGGTNFERNEKWNLGQMCRNTLQNVFLVGFYSFAGEVRAARSWGQDGQVMPLKEAAHYSFEHRMHEWFPGKQGLLALHKVREPSNDRFKYCALSMPLGCEYYAIHPTVRVSRHMDIGQDNAGADVKKHLLDPLKPFLAVQRTPVGKHRDAIRLQISGYDQGQYDGWWISEYTKHGSRTIHCLPATHLNSLAGADANPEKVTRVANFPILQRWVGVSYHPDTEIESHYGEMVISKCYDLAVFVDRTTALDVDLSRTEGITVSASLENETIEPTGAESQTPGGQAVVSKQHNRRLMMEYRRILKNPIEYIETRPLDTNILEWHFVLTGTQDPYLGGKYHGILEFPDDFPMKPPSIKMLTPSGRFEINKRICLSMSDFHKESWNPSWTVEKILIGLMSFMYEESYGAIGSLLESREARRRYAGASAYFNAQNEIYVELFQTPDEDEEEDSIRKLRRITITNQDDIESDKACRYCLVDSGELVAPCECKGSSQWVHQSCLRQWQKSVLLTQSTHPKYQTRIDEICNVCERPFKAEYKPRSRHEALLEYTGEELPSLVQKGNLLASSRPKSERNNDLIRRQQKAMERVGHFTEAVYLIALCEPYSPQKRGGGAVLAVNLVNKIPQPPERTTKPVLSQGPHVEVTAYPLREWQQNHLPAVKALQAACVLSTTSIEHFLGGPVEPCEPFALAEIPAELLEMVKQGSSGQSHVDPGIRRQLNCFEALSPSRLLALAGKLRVKGSTYFGDMQVMLGLLANLFLLLGRDRMKAVYDPDNCHDSCLLGDVPLKVFWGYASWNVTQLLGEIARRGWGLVVTEATMSFSAWEQTVGSWEAVVDKSVIAKASEYSQ